MHNLKFKKITVALCMALMPVSVFAAGLGKLNVMSGLGEPLKADIELISITPEELSSITAAIASQEAYATQGIEKPASHNTIKVDVAKNAAGAPILKLKSAQPISEPFLDMLIQVDWSSGRLLREYTVLLDPPGYTGETDASTSAKNTLTTEAPMVGAAESNGNPAMAATPSGETATENTATSTKKVGKRAKKGRSPAKDVENEALPPIEAAPPVNVTDQEHMTQKGDTLSKIARDMKPEGVSLEQMLVGLYQANPDAFDGKNMNRLKVGQIVRTPSADELNAISRGQASQEVKVQTANWNAYRNKLAGIVQESATNEAESGTTQSAGGKIKSAAEDKSIPAATGPKDVVKLSAGEAAAAKASGENVKSMQDKIAALQEEGTAREKGLKEAQDRTAALEKQIADMQKLLALKDGAMAELQKQAEAAKNKPAEAAATPVAPAKPAEPPTPVEAAKPAEPAPATPEANKEAPKPVVVPPPAPAPEPSFLDGILGGGDMGSLLPVGGGLLALLGGGWFYLRKKREKNLADFEQGIMTSGGLKANTVFGNTGTASVDTGDTSFLTDFSQSATGGMIDTNDVDPIAEAEVYMAYGRDAQAEEILKDAISKEPKRYELHLKLLEMYAASKNMSAFETISGELYTTLGAEDPTWEKVAAIGIKLEPNNPLYQVGSVPAGGGEVATSNQTEAASPAAASAKLDASDFANSRLAEEKDLDFSFGDDADDHMGGELGAPTIPAVAATIPAVVDQVVDSGVMQFSLDAGQGADEPAVADADATLGGMNFDLGDLTQSEPAAAAPAAPSFSNTMPSLDINTFQSPDLMAESADAISMEVEEVKNDMGLGGFELPAADESASAGVLDMSGFESEAADDNTFNFSVNTMQVESPSAKEEVAPINLAGIDLDLGDTDAKPAEPAFAETIDPAEFSMPASEPIEVETKLELVVAYIEMDDKEGAKELLDEVMKEGGTNQRKRAEELLAKLA